MTTEPSSNNDLTVSRSQFLRVAAVGAVGVGAVGLLGCGDDDPKTSSTSSSSSGPSGTLRVGWLTGPGGSTADPDFVSQGPASLGRHISLYDELFYIDDGEVKMRLAEQIEPSADARQWNITLRDGVEFHDGRPLRPEDVVASLKRRQDPENQASWLFGQIKTIRKSGPRNVRLTFDQPYASFLSPVISDGTRILPEDFDAKRPVGTGPYRFESVDPGRRMTLVANPNWWGEGPFIERLETYEFKDEAARLNALLADQIDAMDSITAGQFSTVKTRDNIKTLAGSTDGCTTFVMRLSDAPFTDDRVRQAMRLIVNRKEMNNQVHQGLAVLGNDISGQFDRAYIGNELPQREQDLEQARSLLKAAGREDLRLELETSAIGPGSVEMSQVLAEQAKEAGVTIQLKTIDPQAYFTPEAGYGKRTFGLTGTGAFGDYLSFAGSSLKTGAVLNEVAFSNDRFDRLYTEAMRTPDEAKRNEMIQEMMRIEHDLGGHIVWSFDPVITAYHERVKGVRPVKAPHGLNDYRFATLRVD